MFHSMISQIARDSRRVAGKLLGWVGVSMLLAFAGPSHAQVTGISYTLTPVAQRTYFDSNAGLADGPLVGGRVGLGFGEYVELSGVFMASTDLRTDFGAFSDLGEELDDRFELLPSRDVSLRQYGADLSFNLGRGSITPTLSIGTGVLQLDPANLEESRLIYLSGAAGLQLSIGSRLALLAQVENLTYRYNPSSTLLSENDLGDLGLRPADFRRVNVSNYAVRVGLRVYAGGRARGELSEIDRALREQFSGGLSAIRLQIEPSYGFVDFDEELGYRERQRLGGVLAGFDLGPHFGVRGFYWRGIEDDTFAQFEDLQAYGGEIKLAFGEVAGRFVPHLALGGGYLDVLDGYQGSGAVRPIDRPFAIGGAGLSMALIRGVQLHAAVRTLLLSTDEAEDVSEPSQITANFFYSAGITFGLGGSGYDPSVPVTESQPRARVPAPPDAELARLQRQVDSLAAVLERTSQFGPEMSAEDVDGVPGRDTPGRGTRWITVPLPEDGEFYLRYGDPASSSVRGPGSPRVIYVNPETGEVVEEADPTGTLELREGPLTATEIREIVRDALARELQARGGDRIVLDAGAGSQDVQLLLDRIAQLEARLANRETNLPVVSARRLRDPVGYELASLIPFAGFGLSGEQIVLAGLRGDIRSQQLAGARFLPEVLVAAGTDGASYGLNANVALPLGVAVADYRPYGGLGLGFVTFDGAELVFNLLLGFEQAGLYGRFFGEYMSQDFFRFNRFVVGYRFSF